MRRVAAVVLLVVLAVAMAAPPAEACIECVALGLVSFAVFTQLVAAITAPPVVYAPPAYYAPAYYAYPAPAPAAYYPAYSPVRGYAAYPATYVAAAPAAASPGWTGPRVVEYAHGRYELRGDGVTVPWVWVWIPRAAPPAPTNQDGPEGSGASRTP
jgi:hypothetical protein